MGTMPSMLIRLLFCPKICMRREEGELDLQKVNVKLKAKIIEQFGSRVDFARALKINEQTISRVIRGREGLPEEAQKHWAKKLCCDVKELFLSDHKESVDG